MYRNILWPILAPVVFILDAIQHVYWRVRWSHDPRCCFWDHFAVVTIQAETIPADGVGSCII